MIQLTINEQKYSSIELWSEMSLAKGIEFSALCRTAPDKLKDYYSILSGPGEEKEKAIDEWLLAVGEGDVVKEFPEFYGKVIQLLSNIPEDVIKFLTAGYRIAFYKKYCESFVIGILHEGYDYKPKGILLFEHDGKEYHLPVTRNILGNERPMSDRTAIEFTESADLQLASKEMAGGKFEFAANIVAILCRPMIVPPPAPMPRQTNGHGKNIPFTPEEIIAHTKVQKERSKGILEPYNEATCLERAEKFKELTMDIVFEVFFCLAQHILLFKQRTVISTLQDQIVKQEDLSKLADWNSMDGTHGSSQLQVV